MNRRWSIELGFSFAIFLLAVSAGCKRSDDPDATNQGRQSPGKNKHVEFASQPGRRQDGVLSSMVRVDAGIFRFRQEQSVEGGTLTKVAGFWIDRTEITTREYALCVQQGGCLPPHERWDTCNWPQRKERGEHPINCVEWKQADAFCAWAGKRLPTEQEWEFAARGSDGRVYPWGIAEPKDQACYKRESAKGSASGTCEVSSFAGDISPFGAMGMAGNVKEWTSSVELLPDKMAARVIRGGGWRAEPLSPSLSVRVVEREYLKPAEFASDLGFRCASEKFATHDN